jgi:hypothetical protein
MNTASNTPALDNLMNTASKTPALAKLYIYEYYFEHYNQIKHYIYDYGLK